MNASKVIAIDFDGTLFEERWPEIGVPIWPVINAARAERKNGAELILWTTREGEKLHEAIKACEQVGLHFDVVNTNSPALKAVWGNDPRKIGATEYWDDRAVNVQSLIYKDTNADEIVRALRCCGNTDTKKPDCEHCPLLSTRMCVKVMLEGAADLIVRLNDFDQTQSKIALERCAKAEAQLAVTREHDIANTRSVAQLCGELSAIKAQFAALQRREQAAVDDLMLAAKETQNGVGICVTCIHYPEDMSHGMPPICDECPEQCKFEWRGPQAGKGDSCE